DTFGNIWFGTSKEIVKYDGITFTHLIDNNGVYPICPIYVEKSGTIWRAQKSGGINKINSLPSGPSGPLNFSLLHFGKKEGFTDQLVDEIFQDNSGNLWFTITRDEVLIKLELQ